MAHRAVELVTIPIVVLVLLSLLVSNVGASSLALSTDQRMGAPVANSARPAAASGEASPLQRAMASLARGDGPAGSRSLDCRLDSSTSADCRASVPPSGRSSDVAGAAPIHPEGTPAAPNFQWINVSYLGESGGPYGYFGAMAWDPLLGEAVYFGGCTPAACYSNATWVYSGTTWTDLTPYLAQSPGGRYGMGLDYDPALGTIVLYGGINGTSILDDTWLFDGTWENVSALAGYPPAEEFGSLAWDPSEQGILLTEGCTNTTCTSFLADTWLLTDSGWEDLGVAPGSGGGLYDAAMAYDAADGYMVLFGGDNGTGSVNYTFAFDLGSWVDLTLNDSFCFGGTCYAPPGARLLASLVWDGQLGALVLVGGLNASTFQVYNDTYAFTEGKWLPLDIVYGITPPPATFYGGFAMTVAVNSSAITPLFVGGLCAGGNCSTDEWTFEAPDYLVNLSATPNPADANATVTITAVGAGGYGSGPLQSVFVALGNGLFTGAGTTASDDANWTVQVLWTYGENSPPGNYTILVLPFDFWGVGGPVSELNISIGTNLTAELFTAPAHLEAGSLAAFSVTPRNGTSPYSFAWSFGDGATASGAASVEHSYAAAGTYEVNLTLADHGGDRLQQHRSVTVAPALTASASASYLTVDVGVTDQFTGAGSGGSGSYSGYAWTFGDGGNASAATAGHAYARSGNFTARLNITDSYGFESGRSVAITVNPALAASPTGGGSTTVGTVVDFAGGASAGTAPYTYAWTFGDGTTSTSAAPTHAFATVGTFTVRLWVNDSGGGSVEKTLSVVVGSSSSKSSPQSNSSAAAFPWWIVAIGVVVVLAAGVGGYLLMRSRRPPADGTASPAPAAPPAPGSEAPRTPPPSPPPGGPPPGAMG